MPLTSRQQGPIAVYGATGYTGRLVTAELAAAGAEVVISGRNRQKLDALASETKVAVEVKEATLFWRRRSRPGPTISTRPASSPT